MVDQPRLRRADLIGTILNTMGPEAGKAYLQKLKAQNIAKSTASNRQILDLTIAGEYPLALQIFNHHAYISKIGRRAGGLAAARTRDGDDSDHRHWRKIHRIRTRPCF